MFSVFRQFEDQFSGKILGQKILLGGDDILQRIGFRNDRPYFASFDIADQIFKNGVFLKRTSEKAQIPQVKHTDIQLDHRAGNGARNRVTSPAPKRINQFRPLRPGHEVNHQVNSVRTRCFRKFFAARDYVFGTERPDDLELGRIRNGENLGPRLFASCTAADPTPPEAPVIKTFSPDFTAARCSIFSAVE